MEELISYYQQLCRDNNVRPNSVVVAALGDAIDRHQRQQQQQQQRQAEKAEQETSETTPVSVHFDFSNNCIGHNRSFTPLCRLLTHLVAGQAHHHPSDFDGSRGQGCSQQQHNKHTRHKSNPSDSETVGEAEFVARRRDLVARERDRIDGDCGIITERRRERCIIQQRQKKKKIPLELFLNFSHNYLSNDNVVMLCDALRRHTCSSSSCSACSVVGDDDDDGGDEKGSKVDTNDNVAASGSFLSFYSLTRLDLRLSDNPISYIGGRHLASMAASLRSSNVVVAAVELEGTLINPGLIRKIQTIVLTSSTAITQCGPLPPDTDECGTQSNPRVEKALKVLTETERGEEDEMRQQQEEEPRGSGSEGMMMTPAHPSSTESAATKTTPKDHFATMTTLPLRAKQGAEGEDPHSTHEQRLRNNHSHHRRLRLITLLRNTTALSSPSSSSSDSDSELDEEKEKEQERRRVQQQQSEQTLMKSTQGKSTMTTIANPNRWEGLEAVLNCLHHHHDQEFDEDRAATDDAPDAGGGRRSRSDDDITGSAFSSSSSAAPIPILHPFASSKANNKRDLCGSGGGTTSTKAAATATAADRGGVDSDGWLGLAHLMAHVRRNE